MASVSPSSFERLSRNDHRVLALVRLAFRRKLLTLAVDQFGLVCSAVFGGLVLMLLLGTQILNAWLLFALAVAGMGFGFYQVRSAIPSKYQLAQGIDRKLQLHDSISTAFFLLLHPEQGSAHAVRTQLSQADTIASSVDVATIFPFGGRRQWTIAAALFVAVTGLFATRYLVTNTLDLSLALVPIHLGPVYERVEKLLARSDSRHEMQASGARQDAASTQAGQDRADAQEQGNQSQDPASASTPASSPADPSGGEPNAAKAAGSPNDNHDAKSNGEGDGKAHDNSAAHDASAPGNPTAASKGSPNDAKQTKDQSSDAKSSTGVFEKMRDAVSSMMAKMKASSNGDNSSQESKNQRESQQSAQQSPQKQDQQRGQQGDQNQQSSEDPNSQGQQQAGAAQKAQASEGRTSNSSSNQNGSDSHSGIGSQDGEKALKDSRQQEAMGKLAEIIGKRSAELTGDVMVDVPSGKQQLRTKDSGRLGTHSDKGGQINRDQVPLEFQQYVRDYMEQVRKQPK